MLVMKNQVQINCPLAIVFSFLANPENFPKWNYYLVKVEKIESGNTVIGSAYQQVRKKDEQIFTITGFEENKRIEFSSARGTFLKYKRQFSFSVVDANCMVDDLFEIKTYLPSFINKFIARKPRAAVKENLLKLKQLLETGETTLQDGRKVLID